MRIPVNAPLSCSSFCLAAARAIVTPPFADFDQLAKLLNDASDVREASQTGPASQMIVCSCNVLSDHDVRNAVSGSGSLPRNAKQLYGCLGCSADCGRCARTINTIIKEARVGPGITREPGKVGDGDGSTIAAISVRNSRHSDRPPIIFGLFE